MQRIYLDANATTPVLPEVVEAMRPWFTESFGNPSSAHHNGQRARSAVERARTSVAAMFNTKPKEIVFTSGGTEGANLALFGVLEPYLRANAEPAHLITTQIEHHAVLHAAEALKNRGLAVTFLAPNSDGVIEPAALAAALTPETRLVSVMLANNETGAIQPVGKLARIAKDFAARNNTRILFHTDAVQAAGKLPLDLTGEFINVDLLSISGHKMYSPQGTGALFVRTGVHLTPLFHGGPHERQRRAGTENVPGIVALGRAAELASDWLLTRNSPTENSQLDEHSSATTLAALRDRLEAGLLDRIPNAHINATASPRVPNTINLRVDGIDAEALLIALDVQGISTSFGSACMSGATEPSHVLLAMGLTAAQARSSLRISLTRLTTAEEIDRALDIIPAAVARLRSLK